MDWRNGYIYVCKPRRILYCIELMLTDELLFLPFFAFIVFFEYFWVTPDEMFMEYCKGHFMFQSKKFLLLRNSIIKNLVPPLIFQMPPERGRRALEEMQDNPYINIPPIYPQFVSILGCGGAIPVYFIAPKDEKIRNIIFYIHGAGWGFGSFHTHEKLVRELSARTNSLVVFPESSRSPEAKYPEAIEQCYFLLSHIWEIIGDCFPMVNGAALTVGDSVGENMAIAMVLMSSMRHGPCIHKRFPPTMIINGQADVLRSEGEAFGERLRCAGVEVTALRVQGTIHDLCLRSFRTQP